MTKRKEKITNEDDVLRICEDENDLYGFSDKLLKLINAPNPTDVDEFFDALDEDYEEFAKRAFGDDKKK